MLSLMSQKDHSMCSLPVRQAAGGPEWGRGLSGRGVVLSWGREAWVAGSWHQGTQDSSLCLRCVGYTL